MSQLRYALLAVTVVALVGVSALALTIPNTFVAGEVISAAEMNANFAAIAAAQPRVAYAKVDEDVPVNTATMTDIVSVTIDVPAAGVVIVQYMGQAGFGGVASLNGMEFQIDTNAGGDRIFEEYFLVARLSADTNTIYLPVAAQRAFAVAAGTHEFRAEGRSVIDPAVGNRYMWNPRITATWYPADSVELSAALGTSGVGAGNQR